MAATPISVKVARLWLVSDILHNSSAPVRHASTYRTLFMAALPRIFDHLNGRNSRTEYLDDLIEQGHMLACCPVNFTEVYAGLRPGEEAHTKEFFDRNISFCGRWPIEMLNCGVIFTSSS